MNQPTNPSTAPQHQLRWRSRRQLQNQSIPENWKDWLFDEKSLTKRLQQHCMGQFSVQVLSEEVCQPQHHEAKCLGMNGRRWARIRQVVLLCDQTPLVVARTIIPLSTLQGPLRQLRHLKNRPLGAFLFRHPDLERGAIEVTQLAFTSPPLNLLLNERSTTNRKPWGRRSLFRLKGHPVLVCEIFLQSLLTN